MGLLVSTNKRAQKNLVKGLAVALALFSICPVLTTGSVNAQSTPDTHTTQNTTSQTGLPAQRVAISPLRQEIEIKQGTRYTGTIQLKNTGAQSIKVDLSAEAFQVKDTNYDYTFLPNSPINSWVHFNVSTITIDPGGIYPVHFVINVPLNAEPGGAYISLFASSQSDSSAGIASVNRVGSLLYLTLPGATTRIGSLINFSSPYIGTSEPTWSATIHNSGNLHFQSNTTVSLKTLWGSTVSETPTTSLILPSSIRLLEGTAQSPTWLGLYVLQYDISLGDNGHAVGTRPYLYAPIGQVVVLLILCISALLFMRTWRARRKTTRVKKSPETPKPPVNP
jgi:hypothetical protein